MRAEIKTQANSHIAAPMQVAATKPAEDAAPKTEAKRDSFQRSSSKFFQDDYFSREFVAYDPTTGQASFYKTEEEMQEHQAAILEERKASLMLASAGDPSSLQAIQNSIRSAKLQLGLKQEYLNHEEDKAAVISAAKAQAGSMTVAELKLLAQSYPELNSIVEDRIAQARVRGIAAEDIANMQVRDIDALAKQKLAAPSLSARAASAQNNL